MTRDAVSRGVPARAGQGRGDDGRDGEVGEAVAGGGGAGGGDDSLTWFAPTPRALPTELPSPFEPGPPHPLAQRAADELMGYLRSRAGDALDAPGGGKMFGVLVVAAPDGRVGYLRGFSGMLDGAWHQPGFVPPLYDPAAREAFWDAGQAAVAALDRALAAVDDDDARALADAHAALLARHAAELTALLARHRDHRVARHAARADGADAAALHALAQASRADTAERRALDARHAAALAVLAPRIDALAQQRARIAQQRADLSRSLLIQLHDTYVIQNALGQRRPLRAFYAPGEPPGGAGDCAAPKLLGHAYRLGLRPLALTELWWGAPPATGGRRAGQHYPACHGKCGPILPFMLEGLAHAAAPIFGASSIAADQPRVVFEDPWLIVVDKPCGLLSVPGRSGLLTDSVLTRMRARCAAPELSIVHRLDLDTSGLLILAKDLATHAALQRAFAQRLVDKRYLAALDAAVPGDAGTISLALRVDLDDRPRQIVEPIHGKAAITDWCVLARTATSTRIALTPRTGRTHQLRVHCAVGLDAPIAGDRLYGLASSTAPRLLLHAQSLRFTHPHTGATIDLASPAPF